MGYLDEIISKSKQEVAGYDPDRYREEISGSADRYGVKYTDFSKPGDGMMGVGSPSGGSNIKTILIVSGIVLILAVGGFVIFKKKK